MLHGDHLLDGHEDDGHGHYDDEYGRDDVENCADDDALSLLFWDHDKPFAI